MNTRQVFDIIKKNYPEEGRGVCSSFDHEGEGSYSVNAAWYCYYDSHEELLDLVLGRAEIMRGNYSGMRGEELLEAEDYDLGFSLGYHSVFYLETV